MSYLPTFQAQNPAISGYSLGWSSCTAFSTAMQIDAATAGAKRPTGAEVRQQTGDTTGGLNLGQVDAASQHWGVDLDVRYRLPWDDFVHRVNVLGMSGQLQGWYRPIANSRFDAGNGFYQNHDMLVMPHLVTLDPLADGRFAGVYEYSQEEYPEWLLRSYAGQLNLGSATDYRALGAGLCYAAFHAVGRSFEVTIRPKAGDLRRGFVRYDVRVNSAGDRQVRGSELLATKGFEAGCTPGKVVLTRSGDATVNLVKITQGAFADPDRYPHGFWVSAKWSHVA